MEEDVSQEERSENRHLLFSRMPLARRYLTGTPKTKVRKKRHSKSGPGDCMAPELTFAFENFSSKLRELSHQLHNGGRMTTLEKTSSKLCRELINQARGILNLDDKKGEYSPEPRENGQEGPIAKQKR